MIFKVAGALRVPRRVKSILARYRCLFLLLFITTMLLTAHFLLIPSVFGSYNSECYMSQEDRSNLKYMLTAIVNAFDKYGVIYWLDYGTLLGAVRYKSIVPWDHDGDISVLLTQEGGNMQAALQEIRDKGIHANSMIAQYKGLQVDIMRWKKYEGSYKRKSQTMLYKYYPPTNEDNAIVKFHHTLESFPYAWIESQARLKFLDTYASVPKEYMKLLRLRYPWTLYFPFPYKWKCWAPCSLVDKAEGGCVENKIEA